MLTAVEISLANNAPYGWIYKGNSVHLTDEGRQNMAPFVESVASQADWFRKLAPRKADEDNTTRQNRFLDAFLRDYEKVPGDDVLERIRDQAKVLMEYFQYRHRDALCLIGVSIDDHLYPQQA